MIRLIKILIIFVSHSFSQMFAYKTTSVFVVVFGTLFSIAEIIATQIYYSYTDTIMGWDKYNFLILLGTFSLIQYIYQFLFVLQHEEFMDKIIEGELDYDLIRPIDSQLINSFRFLDIPSLINMIIPFALIVYSLNKLNIKIEFSLLLGYTILIIIGVVFYYCLNQIVVSLAFWIERPGKLLGMPEYLFDLASRPSSIYPKFLKLLLVFFIPVLSSTNLPVEYLTNNFDKLTTLNFIVVTLLFLIFTRWQWKRGLRKYVSTS